MKQKLKKNWHIILIAILMVFSMSKCTQSCNRASTISTITLERDSLANVVDTLKQQNEILSVKLNGMQDNVDLLNGVNDKMREDKLKLDSIDRVNKWKNKSRK